MDANWTSSFAGTKRMGRSIVPVRDGAVKVRRVMASAVEADSYLHTDDIWHLTAGWVAVWDRRAEMRPKVNLLMQMMHWGGSREWHYQCVPIAGVGKALRMPQTAFHNSSNQHRPSCTCFKVNIKRVVQLIKCLCESTSISYLHIWHLWCGCKLRELCVICHRGCGIACHCLARWVITSAAGRTLRTVFA